MPYVTHRYSRVESVGLLLRRGVSDACRLDIGYWQKLIRNNQRNFGQKVEVQHFLSSRHNRIFYSRPKTYSQSQFPSQDKEFHKVRRGLFWPHSTGTIPLFIHSQRDQACQLLPVSTTNFNPTTTNQPNKNNPQRPPHHQPPSSTTSSVSNPPPSHGPELHHGIKSNLQSVCLTLWHQFPQSQFPPHPCKPRWSAPTPVPLP